MLPTGVYGFSGMNGTDGIGGPTPNGVGLVPSLNTSVTSTSPTSVAPSIGQSVGQTPYWQTADPALLAAWTAAASGGTGGVRPTVFTSQQVSGNKGGATTDVGDDLLKLFTNPFADVSTLFNIYTCLSLLRIRAFDVSLKTFSPAAVSTGPLFVIQIRFLIEALSHI